MKRSVLMVLAAAQFLMVLDQAVMNVSISQLVEDFDTDVTTIQAAITFYALVMAALMITGGKLGDRWGRKRAFTIGLAIYAVGSALTAVSWNVNVLILGWSIIEGVGAALGDAGHGGVGGGQLRRQGPGRGLRRAGRRGRCRHRGGSHPGRLGHHLPDVAAWCSRARWWSPC